MADDKIVIEIITDEGKAIKGVDELKKRLGGDATKSAEGLEGALKGAFNQSRIGSFVAKVKGIHPAIIATTAGVVALGATLKAALKGEEIAAIREQFNLLSKQAGVSGDAIRESISAASDGRNLDEALQAASKYLVEFGDNANRLGEVFTVARKATALFGGDVVDNFEKINKALASGQSQALRNFGIIIDQEQAYKDFAASIGVTSDQLNEAGRRQAVFDAFLKKSSETFKNVDPNIRQVSESIKNFKDGISSIGDAISGRISSIFGKFFATVINGFAKAGQAVANFLRVKTPIEETTARLEELRATLDRLESAPKFTGLQAMYNVAPGRIKKVRDEIVLLEERLKALRAEAEAGAESEERIFVDPEKIRQELAAANATVISARLARISAEMQLDLTDAERRELAAEQVRAIEERTRQELEIFDANHKLKLLLGEERYQELRAEITRRGNAEVAAAMRSHREQIEITSLQIAQGLAGAMQAAVVAMRQGQNGLEAFGSAILSFIGDIAIQIGTTLISVGIGMEAIRASIIGMTGGPAIFAGLALVALGALLKSLSGGGASTSAPSTTPAAASDPGLIEPPEIEEQKPTNQIHVNVQGDVLDSRDSGMRIVDLIKEYTDRNGRTEVFA